VNGVSDRPLPPAVRRYRQTRFELKTLLGRYPRVYLPLARRRARGEPVRPDTDFVIEGFPRSGNTFATAAFGLALSTRPPPQPVVAHHLHVPAQVIAAVRRGVPALVLIRRPEEAVLSLVVQQPHVSLRQALRAYLRFYRPLVRHRHRLVLATFDDVIGDFGAVTTKVNQRFGVSFPIFQSSDENVGRALRLIEEENRDRWGAGREVELKGAFPSEERTRLKERLRVEYRRDALRRLRHRAEELYVAFTLGSAASPPHPRSEPTTTKGQPNR
jgi:hypothetical protein